MVARTIAVDWSGAVFGSRRKIWLAEVRDGDLVLVENGRSRAQLIDYLVAEAAADPDLVVGLDFAFSMPAWFVKESGADSAAKFWDVVADKGEEWLRECRSPFWGRPGRPRPAIVSGWRCTESDLAPIRGIRIKSTFQIGGAGAVGTGSIRGMPHLRVLRTAGFAVWPFDPPSLPLVLEIYPRLLTGAVNRGVQRDREGYLLSHFPDLDPTIADIASSSEDAFDAAVSALVMDRQRDSLTSLTQAEDEETLVEGRVWVPPAIDTTVEEVSTRSRGRQRVREQDPPSYSATRLQQSQPGDLLPRERLKQHGAQTLSDTELLAVLLGKGVRGFNVLEVARQVLTELKSIPGVQKATLDELRRIRGMGEAKALQVKAALELGRRLIVRGDGARPTVRSPLDVAMLLISDMGLLEQEELRVMLLNTRNEIVATETVYRGSVNSAQVRASEVLRVAIRANVPAMVLVHNHPSGDPTPSRDDVAVTEKLVEAARGLDIEIFDHIIIGNPDWASMRQQHLGFKS